MDHRSTPYVPRWRMLRSPDLLAGACSLGCLGGLIVAGAPTTLSLTLPLLSYAGLRLLVVNDLLSQIRDLPDRWVRREPTLNVCHRLAEELRTRIGEADDRDVAARLRRIQDWIDRSLNVIREDGRAHASEQLLGLIETTIQLLNAYMRLARRELASREARAAFLGNLETLETAYESAWLQLNREAIVALGTLSDMIDLTTVPDRPSLTAGNTSNRSRDTAFSSVTTHSRGQR